MSLHCPATLIVVRAVDDPRVLAATLEHRRVAVVYSASGPEAERMGRDLAAMVGAAATTLPGLELAGGGPGTATEAFAGLEDELGALADLHRGETVVVLTPAPGDADWSAFEVEIGDDGVRVVPVAG